MLRTLLCLLAALPLSAAAQQIEEWKVPWEDTRPRDPSVAADGRVWFVGQRGNYLGLFDPSSQEFQRFELPAGTRPHTVVVDPKGQPWVAGNGNGTLLRYDAGGALQQTISVPPVVPGLPSDPHTLAFDGSGGLWFTMQNGNAIGHLDAAGGLRTVRVPSAQARPYGIVATPEGDAWAVLFGVGKLAFVDRANMALREVALPRELARPRRIGLDAEGGVWYVDFAQDHLGRHDPARGETREWPLTPRPALPYAMAMDDHGRPWLFLTGPKPNLAVPFDVQTGQLGQALAVPSGGQVVRHAQFHTASRSIWFGTDANTLGRLALEEAGNP
jgi:virginiamycin B lyase